MALDDSETSFISLYRQYTKLNPYNVSYFSWLFRILLPATTWFAPKKMTSWIMCLSDETPLQQVHTISLSKFLSPYKSNTTAKTVLLNLA